MSEKKARENNHRCHRSDRPGLLGIDWIAAEKGGWRVLERWPNNVLIYAKFTARAWLSGSVALKQYLEDQKILPTHYKKKNV